MPSGVSRLYQNYTDADLQTAFASVQADLLSGRFSALNGAQKSGSLEYLALDKQMKEINFEMNKRGLGRQANPPQRVTQVLNHDFGCWEGGYGY